MPDVRSPDLVGPGPGLESGEVHDDGARPVEATGDGARVAERVEPVRAVLVVIPARDEEALIGACLDALEVAANAVPSRVEVLVSVVLDGCRDGTAEVVEAHERIHAVVTDVGRMGEVRSAGVDGAVEALGADLPPAAQVWVAQTDADTIVPRHWLTEQLAMADAGCDLVLGTVEPDGTDADHRTSALWAATHDLAEGHGGVHGANLGVRLSAYRAVGGHGGESHSEDAALAHVVRAAGFSWLATDRTRVVTSARRQGRAQHGFAQFLRRLDATTERLGDVAAVEAQLRQAVLDLAEQRAPDRTLCPSEAARVVDPDGFRELTVLARAVACRLADEGLVEVTQRGVRVDGLRARGPVRIRLVARASQVGGALS